MPVRATFFSDDAGKAMVEYTIPSPGRVTNDTIVKKVEPSDVEQFPAEWEAFQAGSEMPEPDGTALTEVPGVSRQTSIYLRLKGVRVAEELAALSDAECNNLGSGFLTLRKSAQNMILAEQARETAPVKRGPGRPRKAETEVGEHGNVG